MPQVTIEAKGELETKIRKFVNRIAVQEDGGAAGLARWGTPPVCPLVSGLTRQQGEFILERLSEVARTAAVPLAGEKCRSNLYVLVTPQPEDLLRGMEKRNRKFTFGYEIGGPPPHSETPVPLVDEFIKTPRAVRVWYNSNGKDDWGLPLQFVVIGRGSHLVFDSVWTFSRVFVIVDQRRLQKVGLEQLADYVAMVGFAKLKPDALGDAKTILKLFDADPKAAPARMTSWDQAFLKALYATEQESKQQRGAIADDIVRETAH